MALCCYNGNAPASGCPGLPWSTRHDRHRLTDIIRAAVWSSTQSSGILRLSWVSCSPALIATSVCIGSPCLPAQLPPPYQLYCRPAAPESLPNSLGKTQRNQDFFPSRRRESRISRSHTILSACKSRQGLQCSGIAAYSHLGFPCHCGCTGPLCLVKCDRHHP